MKKLLRMQDVLLLGLFGGVDVFNELKDPLGMAGDAYKNLYGWIPNRFKKTNYYQSFYHCLKTGYIEKIIKNDQPYLRLTSKGKEKIQRDFSIVRWQNQKWDGKWRAVIFDIEEKQRKKRDSWREKLRELGFGMIQESVWVSPYDIILDLREFIKNMGLQEEIFVMEVSHLLAGNPKILASKIWSLEKINSYYKELFNLLTNLHDRVKKSIYEERMMEGKTKDKIKEKNQILKELKLAREKYLEILKEDPGLPKELLPEDWFGERVKRLIYKNFKVK